MANVSWIATTGGDWATGSKWSNGVAPTASDDVTINPASAQNITLSGGSDTAHSLTGGAHAHLILNGASLTLGAASTLAGAVDMSAGLLAATGNLSIAGFFTETSVSKFT